jgi:threonine dehydratase
MNKLQRAPLPLQEVIRPTTIIDSPRLSQLLGVKVTLASETFQHTGSFKFRAAYNLAARVSQDHLIAASSGNFGQALAYACALLGKSCTVVMPDNSSQVKVDAVREYGGTVDLINTRLQSREERVRELAASCPNSYTTNAYDDPLIIEGNASLGEELSALNPLFDFIIVPIGGGGLSSGVINGIRRCGRPIKVIGAEPAIANRTVKSLRAGSIVTLQTEPQTIADGARTLSLGKHNWEILKDGLSGIVEVSEEKIKEGVNVLNSYANLKAEPTGALSLGALLMEPMRFQGKSVCCVVSGGNVDMEVYRSLLEPNAVGDHGSDALSHGTIA